MAEYIKRKAVIDLITRRYENPEICTQEINSIPAADVAPVRHGRWIERKSIHAEGGIIAKCSACQKDVQYLGNPLKFFPNCGTKMDGGVDDG